MSEQKPEDDLTIVGDTDTGIPDENVSAVPPEVVESDENTVESEEVQPDSYPEAAENDPDHWRQDPLLSDEEPVDDVTSEGSDNLDTASYAPETLGSASGATGAVEDETSDQSLRDETAEERFRTSDEQVPPEEPTLGEAAADVDFGDALAEEEVDASDDPANSGGRPLSRYNTDDAEQ